MGFDLSSITSLFKKDIHISAPRANVIGIDIGSSSIKIAQLRDEKGVPTLETYGELQLGSYEGVDIGRLTNLPKQKLSEALADIIREAGATVTDAAFAISYNASFTSVIRVPTIDPEQIGSMIPIEARKYIPASLSKVTLDWVPIGVQEKTGETAVLISAVFNEASERFESVMKSAGLTIHAREIEIFSTIRSAALPKDEVVAILDFGASSTRLYIVEKGIVKNTHNVPLAGTELTVALTTALNMEFDAAELEKRTHGLVGDPRIQKALKTDVVRGLRELHTVLKRHEAAENVQVQKIVMSGGGSLLRGLDAAVHDLFSLPVIAADPFAKVAYPLMLEETLKSAGPAFAVAVGVALQAFQPTT